MSAALINTSGTVSFDGDASFFEAWLRDNVAAHGLNDGEIKWYAAGLSANARLGWKCEEMAAGLDRHCFTWVSPHGRRIRGPLCEGRWLALLASLKHQRDEIRNPSHRG